MVMDQVELRRPAEGVRQVQPLPHLGVHLGRFLVSGGHHGTESRARARVGGREQCYLHPGRDEALGEQRHHPLPRAVVARGHSPSDWGEHADAQRAVVHRVSGKGVHASDTAGAMGDREPRGLVVLRNAQPE
jgi:hypothetical protein